MFGQVQNQPQHSKTRDWSDICGLDDDLFISCCRCCFSSCNKLTSKIIIAYNVPENKSLLYKGWTCGISQMTVTAAAVFLIVVIGQ